MGPGPGFVYILILACPKHSDRGERRKLGKASENAWEDWGEGERECFKQTQQRFMVVYTLRVYPLIGQF